MRIYGPTLSHRELGISIHLIIFNYNSLVNTAKAELYYDVYVYDVTTLSTNQRASLIFRTHQLGVFLIFLMNLFGAKESDLII